MTQDKRVFWLKVKKADPPKMGGLLSLFLKNAYVLSWSQIKFKTSQKNIDFQAPKSTKIVLK